MSATDFREQFLRAGYLVLPQLIADDAVAELRELYDAVLDRRIDCAQDDRMLGNVTRQIMNPSRQHAGFRDNAALRAARSVAAAALDCPQPVPVFSMLIYKPPLHAATTPWHQDQSYRHLPFTRAGTPIEQRFLQFWLTLDDVDCDTGCMHFLPGYSLDRMLPHEVAGGAPDDDGRLLAIAAAERELPLATAVACPLAAGGCTAHGPGTAHFTSANQSSTRHRRAYIFNFAAPVS